MGEDDGEEKGRAEGVRVGSEVVGLIVGAMIAGSGNAGSGFAGMVASVAPDLTALSTFRLKSRRPPPLSPCP